MWCRFRELARYYDRVGNREEDAGNLKKQGNLQDTKDAPTTRPSGGSLPQLLQPPTVPVPAPVSRGRQEAFATVLAASNWIQKAKQVSNGSSSVPNSNSNHDGNSTLNSDSRMGPATRRNPQLPEVIFRLVCPYTWLLCLVASTQD